MACVEFIYGPLAENPRRVGKPLRGELMGQFFARRGTFRIVYEFSDDVSDEPDATSAAAADARDDDTGSSGSPASTIAQMFTASRVRGGSPRCSPPP